MSYDIRFAVETVHPDNEGEKFVVVGQPEYDSPTYNYRPMFVACMDWEYKQGEWYPMVEVLPKLKSGLHELRAHPDKYRALEPENRWGTYEGAVECFESWLHDLEPTSPCCGWEFHVTDKWPLEALYWRW